jgi:hypothetical protein
MTDRNTSDATRALLHKRGLPQFDPASFNKGLSDGFRGQVWWPGPGTEPLSYAAGYQEAGVRNPRTESEPVADLSPEPTPPDRVTGSVGVIPDEAVSPVHRASLMESDLDSMITTVQTALVTSAPLSPRPYRRAR